MGALYSGHSVYTKKLEIKSEENCRSLTCLLAEHEGDELVAEVRRKSSVARPVQRKQHRFRSPTKTLYTYNTQDSM